MYIYKHFESLPDTTSQIFDWKSCQTDSFSLFDRNKTQPQNKQDKWTTASLSIAERWTITEIRRQSNSVLTYSLLYGGLGVP